MQLDAVCATSICYYKSKCISMIFLLTHYMKYATGIIFQLGALSEKHTNLTENQRIKKLFNHIHELTVRIRRLNHEFRGNCKSTRNKK